MLKAQWHEARLFRAAPRDAIAQDVADGLRRRIVAGDLPVNGKLPSIQKLASWYGVSLPTMQASIHILRAIGLVRVMPGVGTFVAHPREHGAALNHAWLRASTHELALLRYAMDSQLPIVVAERIRATRGGVVPRTVAELSFLARELALSRHSWPETYFVADVAFHRSIARAVPGAEMLAPLYQRLVDRMKPSLMAALDLEADAGLSELHVALSEALIAGHRVSAGRLARAVARYELAALDGALG